MSKKHKEKDRKKIAVKLHQFRDKNDLTQEELAKKLYTSVFTVSRWERGKNYPNGATVRLMKMLGVLSEE